MATKTWIATVCGPFLIACGLSACGASTHTDPGGGGAASGGSGANTTTANGASSSGGGGGSGSSADSGGRSGGIGPGHSGQQGSSGAQAVPTGGGINLDASIADADLGQTVTLTADAFTVAPGDEVYKCQVFKNPFGASVDLLSLHGVMSAGSHHFFLFNMDPTSGRTDPTPLQDCLGAGLEFHPFPFLSQQPDWTVRFPTAADGSPMGYPLVAANSLMINVHYLNSTAQPIDAKVSITIAAAAPGVVKTHVGTLFLNNSTLTVPVTPKSAPMDESMDWIGSLPNDYSIFTSWSHMHKWSVDFQASTNGNVFYEEPQWDEPQLYQHNPPIPMTASQTITWTCRYYNDTGSTLTFGDSAIKNVMCIYLGQYYPADPTNPDVIYVIN